MKNIGGNVIKKKGHKKSEIIMNACEDSIKLMAPWPAKVGSSSSSFYLLGKTSGHNLILLIRGY